MRDQKFVTSQKKIIEREIDRLEKDIAKSKKFQEIGSTNEDNALEFESFEGKMALLKNSEKELVELKSSLKQIKDNKYGLCRKCGQPIETGRLKAYPAAQYCATDAVKK